MTSRTVTFWWNRMAAGAMMKMGVRAKSVCAMPVAVYWVASSDALTPMNGPKMVVAANGTQISQKLADLTLRKSASSAGH